MQDTIPKTGRELNQEIGGPVGVWAEGDHVMIRAVTKDGQAVSLTPEEALNLAEMIKVFVAQIERDKKE